MDRPITQINPADLNVEQRLVYLYDQVKKLKVSTVGTTTAVTSKPTVPAPQITQALTATGSGVQFTFSQVNASNIDGYNIYRSADIFPNAVPIGYVKQSPSHPTVTVSDPTPAGSTFFFWVTAVDTTGTESSPSAAQAVAVKSGSLVGSDGQVTFSSGTGKNMLGNPGFELNVSNTPISTNLKVNDAVSDGWVVFDKSDYHSTSLDGGFARGGNNAAMIDLAQSITVPNDSVVYESLIATKARIPLAIGDIVRVSGYVSWQNTVGLPAGVTVFASIGIRIYDNSGAFAGQLTVALSTPGGAGVSYSFIQNSMQIPATLGGKIPAFAQFICGAFVQNTGGGGFSTGANTYARIRFDDLKLVMQNTAFDLTPINTASTFTTTASPLVQHGAASTQIDVGSSTLQFGDGTISYNSGSVSPGGFGTWYIYADDPTFAGGAVSYQATSTPANTVAANGRIYFGKITTVNGSVPTGTGGGTGGGGPRGKDNLA